MCYSAWMKYTKFRDSYVIRFERGEEIVGSLIDFCDKEGVKLAEVSGIGAAEMIELGYYKVPTRDYKTKMFQDEHEITGLLGNVSTLNSKPYLHLHATIGDENFNAFAGHLVRATVSGTCEAIVRLVDGDVDRFRDEEETGLNLWEL